MKCQCAWIDENGSPTPDNEEAFALAVCYNPISFGENGCRPFAICQQHALKRGKFWKLLPLPGQTMDEAHQEVKFDAKYFHIIPNIIRDSVVKSFPKEAVEILNSIYRGMDAWYFTRNGILYGVEEDGYLHS